MRKDKGFSLIELLIVIAVILVIAAIAIPNLLRSRVAANEASAVASVRGINIAQVTYASTWVNSGYTTLPQLGGATPCVASAATACLLDATITVAPFTKSGYVLASAPIGAAPVTQYTVNADPTLFGRTGTRHFFSDESSVIRVSTTVASANVNSPALGQ